MAHLLLTEKATVDRPTIATPVGAPRGTQTSRDNWSNLEDVSAALLQGALALGAVDTVAGIAGMSIAVGIGGGLALGVAVPLGTMGLLSFMSESFATRPRSVDRVLSNLGSVPGTTAMIGALGAGASAEGALSAGELASFLESSHSFVKGIRQILRHPQNLTTPLGEQFQSGKAITEYIVDRAGSAGGEISHGDAQADDGNGSKDKGASGDPNGYQCTVRESETYSASYEDENGNRVSYERVDSSYDCQSTGDDSGDADDSGNIDDSAGDDQGSSGDDRGDGSDNDGPGFGDLGSGNHDDGGAQGTGDFGGADSGGLP